MLEWQIASRYLKSKRKESFIAFISWFATIGIMLGVAVLIIVMSVMNGFRKEIVASLVGTNGHLFIYGNNNKIADYKNILHDLEKNSEIINAGATVSGQILLIASGLSSGAVVSGMSYKDLLKREIISSKLTKAQLDNFQHNENAIFIGRVIARNLNIKIGENVSLISPDGYTTVFGSIPKTLGFKVAGIINTGMYQYDSSTVIIPFNTSQKFFNYENYAQRIDIFIKNPDNARNIQLDLLKNYKNIQHVETWQDSNKYLINALEVERNVMFLILSLVILIAAFNIVSGLIMLVRSKTKEIAILRTIGLSKKSIIIIFLLVGIRIGSLGTLLGGLVGTLFSYNIETIRKILEAFLGGNLFAEEIYFLSKLPTDVQSIQVLGIIVIALSFSVLSAIYPAVRAAKIKPVEGLKYE